MFEHASTVDVAICVMCSCWHFYDQLAFLPWKKSCMNENSCLCPKAILKFPINKTTQPSWIGLGFPQNPLEIIHLFPPSPAKKKWKFEKARRFGLGRKNKTTHLPYSLRGLWGIQQPGAFGGPNQKPPTDRRLGERHALPWVVNPGELSE